MGVNPIGSQQEVPKVLIIEDELDLALTLKSALEGRGYTCRICKKVAEAMMKVQNEKFAVIIMDLKIQQGSSEKILEFIKTDKGQMNHDTPVILASGYLDPDLIKKLGKWITGAFVKPFEMEQLLAKIDQLTQLTRQKAS